MWLHLTLLSCSRPLPEPPLQARQGVRGGRQQLAHVCVPGPLQLPRHRRRLREGEGRICSVAQGREALPEMVTHGDRVRVAGLHLVVQKEPLPPQETS